MEDTAPIPPRLFELVMQGSSCAKLQARKAALRYWAVAIVAAVVGAAAPSVISPVAMFVIAGAFVFLAMSTNAGVSLEPPNDLADGLRQRHVALVLHVAPRRGESQLLFLRGPKERWSVRLQAERARELLTLLGQHLPSLPVRAYDAQRLREWRRNWESQPWQDSQTDAAPVVAAPGSARS